MKQIILGIATAIGLSCLVYPQNSFADIFKSSEFLQWPLKSQAFYIRNSIGMASLIAGRNDKRQGKCIDDWYFAAQDKANAHIIAVMKKHAAFHPRGVMLAVIEKQCGKLIYTNNKR